MLKEFEGQMPKIDKKAHAFESADLIGKVEMKEYSSEWFNAVSYTHLLQSLLL